MSSVSSRGEFWRLLTGGFKYKVRFHAYDYVSSDWTQIAVKKEGNPDMMLIRLKRSGPEVASMEDDSAATISPSQVADGLQQISEAAANSPSGHTTADPKQTLGFIADAVRQKANITLRPDGFLRAPEFVYHKYNNMRSFLHFYARKYPNLAKLYSVGRSVQGNQLWVMEVRSTSVCDQYEHLRMPFSD